MPSADDRIVRMEFDNAAFEKKINSTLASLAQLDKALKFTGASKGLSDVSTAASKVDFSHMSNSLEDVSKKFIALSTIAITTLVAITNKAIQTGVQLTKAFTIAPIVDGFKEYETQLNSVQTILANTASKGTTLDQVNDALQKLNEYSDQTIYNFGQMARNIGTFTAAGVDLDTSVQAIKGIANLAALSGSSAEQASNAMYQLSQAIATGTLRLIDWNSVNAAGIGGEVFQNALFETGKALKTLKDVPMTQTFKEWTAAGNTFRGSLEDDWITADVLNTTLATFTGDLTEEMLIAKGFSQDVATSILKTAAIAKAAATEVKTFTQLIGTVKEAVGTGWADSFKIIIGNFTQAKELWTGVNNSIGAFVKENADARNALLSGWALFGGRDNLIEGIKTAFENLGKIIAPIKEAFSNIFPPLTVKSLLDITDAIVRFAEALQPSQITIDKTRIIFQGLFSILSIGWEIIKEGTRFLINLGKSLLSLVTPEASDFLVKLGLGLSDLQGALVKGEGIKKFFETLGKALQKPIEFLIKFKEAIGDIFSGFRQDVADGVDGSVERLSSRFEGLKRIFETLGDIWGPLETGLMKIIDVLERVWGYVKRFFTEFGQRLANVMGPGDFDAFLDAVNTALFGGFLLLIKKFMDTGLKIDIGGGLVNRLHTLMFQITNTFGELTKTLQAMQMNIKANAILKIAGAVGILTASVLVLSMIDSAALSKALAAMAVGFTQLMASFSVFTKIASTPASALAFTIMSAGLIALSSALLVLSAVVKVLGSMSLEEIARGMGAIAGLLTTLTVASKFLAANSKGMITAGVGLTAMAVALTILSVAMKIYATLSWEEIGKGLVAVAGLLVLIAAAMWGMPSTMPITAAGLILVGVALTILAGAMALFGHMKWIVIAKGLVAIGGGLLIIAGAMQLMPITLPITAAGLILVGLALVEIAGAMTIMGKMSWEEIARGLTAMAGSMVILAAAMYAMSGSILGALALLIVSNALLVFAGVLKIFGTISWDTILDSLLKVGIALGAFAIISLLLQPATLSMLALGAALVVLGIGFALVGVGAFLVAKAFETFAKAGDAGIEMVKELIGVLTESLPALAKALAKGVVGMLQVFLKAAPVFAKMIGKLVDNIIEALIPLVPKLAALIGVLIDEILGLIRAKAQPIIQTVIFLIVRILTAIKNHIGDIVEIAVDIVVEFVDALARKLDEVVDSVVNLFVTWFTSISKGLGKISATLVFGMGEAFIEGFIDGLEETASSGLMAWLVALPGKIIEWIGDLVTTLWDKGTELIGGLISGITTKVMEIIVFFLNLPGNIVSWIGDLLGTLKEKGINLIEGFWNGIKDMFETVKNWLGGIPGRIWNAITGLGDLLKDKGQRVIEGFWQGMKDIWDDIVSWVKRKVEDLVDQFTSLFGIFSPSRVMRKIGQYVIEGFNLGMEDLWADTETWLRNLDPAANLNSKMADNMSKTLSNVLTGVVDGLSNDIDMSPVITPVLDLTQLKESAARVAGYLPASTTYSHAQTIAKQRIDDPTVVSTVPSGDVTFEQTINSPTQLSTSDIYKNTRNQIAMAKEVLSIP